eukprot:503699-Pelagomonas_calceolata.AAC.3
MQAALCSPAAQLLRLSVQSFRMLPHAAAAHSVHFQAFSSGGLLAPLPHAQRPLTNCFPQGHTVPGVLNSIQNSRSSRKRRDPLPQLHPPMLSSFATSAAREVADASPQGPGVTATAPPKPSSPLAMVQQAGIQIPQYCCGCGVKLQQVDPEGSGSTSLSFAGALFQDALVNNETLCYKACLVHRHGCDKHPSLQCYEQTDKRWQGSPAPEHGISSLHDEVLGRCTRRSFNACQSAWHSFSA